MYTYDVQRPEKRSCFRGTLSGKDGFCVAGINDLGEAEFGKPASGEEILKSSLVQVAHVGLQSLDNQEFSRSRDQTGKRNLEPIPEGSIRVQFD